MDATRWSALQDLFARALEVPPDERVAFLDASCPDPSLRDEVLALLEAAEHEGPIDSLASRFTPVRDLLSERVPSQVGPYTVSDRIGAGGMAVVYRAHDPRLRRDVALKFLPATLRDHSPAAYRLIEEARAASALDHPNICTIYDIASAEDRLFIAMAYYPGGTLEDRLRTGPLPFVEAIDIACRVAEALQCAHEAGIVHRDVKPANIAFGERDEVKVLDFGVAALTDEAPEFTAGTPSYMAPEQVRGDPADPCSDVWALGVVLFEMLTAARPFNGNSRDEIHDEILNIDAPPVTSLRPETPHRLAAIVDRALAKNPAQRFLRAADFAAALESARHSLIPARTFRRGAYIAAVIAFLIVTGLIAQRQSPGSRAATVVALQPGVTEQYERARERYARGTSESNEAAIVILRNILAQDSMHAPSRALLASAYAVSTSSDYARRGETEWLDSAMIHARAAIAVAPELPHGHAAFGTVLRWSGRLDDAKAEFKRALALDAAYAPAMLELGLLSHILSEPAQALTWLERGLALEPAMPAVRQHTSMLYRTYNLPDDARRHVETGRLIAPDDASIIWESVLIALGQGDTATARADFDTYIQLTSAGERERMHAWFDLLIGDVEGSREHLDRLDLSASPWYDLRQFGVAYIELGERQRGEALLRQGMADLEDATIAPEWGRSLPVFRAHMAAALGDRETAISELERWLENGGYRSWRRMDIEGGWSRISDDPRFMEIIRRSEERFRERRQFVIGELRRLRD